MRLITKGSTSQSVYFDVLDSTSTSGGRLTGLAYNSSGLSAYYVRNGGIATAITLATLAAANSAWSSGGFVEIDATNMPGVYRLDVPDAAFATGSDSVVITLQGATDMAQVSYDVQLTGLDLQSATVNVGEINSISASSVTTVNANLGTTEPINFTGTGTSALAKSDAVDVGGTAQTGADIGVLLGTPAGASVSADIAAAKSVVDTIKTVTDKITFTVGNSVVAAITAAGDFVQGAADIVWSSAARTLTAGTNIVLAKGTGVTGFNDLDAAGVRGAVGLAAADLDTQLGALLPAAFYTAPDNTSIAAIKAKTDNLPADPADESLIIAATDAIQTSIAAVPSANQNADALLDRADGVETGLTIRQHLRLAAAALFGKLSGAGTATVAIRDTSDTKNRISASVDADGNRTAVTLDPS